MFSFLVVKSKKHKSPHNFFYINLHLNRKVLSKVPHESTAQKLSSEWSHTWLSSKDCNTKCRSHDSFHLNGHTLGFHPQT